jgi:hypothetical protein
MTDLREFAVMETPRKPSHSPLPWSLTATSRHMRTGGGINSYVLDADGAYVTNEIRRPENAEFIVRAVNSHHQLIEALKDVIARLDHVFATGEVILCDDAPTRFSELEDIVRAALAAAEGSK